MCVVSMVMDGWRDPTWPYNPIVPWKPPVTTTNAIPWQTIVNDPGLAIQMLEVLKKLEALDKRLGMLEQCKVSAEEKKRLKAELRKVARKKK